MRQSVIIKSYKTKNGTLTPLAWKLFLATVLMITASIWAVYQVSINNDTSLVEVSLESNGG